MSNYATKEELNDATGLDASNLVAKVDLIALKAGVDKLDINKLVNVPSSLNDLKKKIQHTKSKSKLFRKENSWCIYFNSVKSIQHR